MGGHLLSKANKLKSQEFNWESSQLHEEFRKVHEQGAVS